MEIVEREGNIFRYWLIFHGYDQELHTDLYRVRQGSQRWAWLKENIGKGSRSAGRYTDQAFFVYESSRSWPSVMKDDYNAIGFHRYEDALLFKMRWE